MKSELARMLIQNELGEPHRVSILRGELATDLIKVTYFSGTKKINPKWLYQKVANTLRIKSKLIWYSTDSFNVIRMKIDIRNFDNDKIWCDRCQTLREHKNGVCLSCVKRDNLNRSQNVKPRPIPA